MWFPEHIYMYSGVIIIKQCHRKYLLSVYIYTKWVETMFVHNECLGKHTIGGVTELVGLFLTVNKRGDLNHQTQQQL